MEVFVRFNYNGTLLTNGTISISGTPEQIFYVKLDEPVNKLLEKINEAVLFSKQRGIIARDATLQEVKQVKSENTSFFPTIFGSNDNLMTLKDKTLKDVLTLEPGKRIILDVQFTGSIPIEVKPAQPQAPQSFPAQGGRKSRRRKSRKNKRS